jgi:menaquinone-9 beta-reductase
MGLGRELRTWETVKGLRVHGGGRTLELEFPEMDKWPNFGLVKPRKDLDQIVLNHAEAEGAKVLYATEAKEPIFEGGVLVGLTAKRNGDTEEIRAKWTVCAEGAATKFARNLGRSRDPGYPIGFAIRQYFNAPALANSGWFDAWLDVRSAEDHLPAYGWLFPVGDGTVNVGVGLLSTYEGWKQVNLNRLQDTFISMIPESWEINENTVASKPRVGRLFMGGSVWPPHGPGFILVGDAAGMINPCNGEGIAYGYETGRIGGRHLDEALRNGADPSLASYTADLKATYGPYYRLGRRFVKAIGNPELMEKLVSLGMRSKKLMNFAMTILANLEDTNGKKFDQKGLRVLKKLAELKSS